MSNLSPVTHSVDFDGIAWLIFDDPLARANVFNPATLSALQDNLRELSTALESGRSTAKAVVIVSGKEKIFLAGADFKWLAALPDTESATIAAREGQAVFELIANFKVPVVCAIHGACAGGGYELALACGWRVATNAPETRIGLPEVRLGLIPGWGGCTRLPRLIGAQRAVEFILKASLVSAANALALGLIDEVVPAAELKERAKAAALRLASAGVPPRTAPAAAAGNFFGQQREVALTRWRGQPAAIAVLDAVEKGTGLGFSDALALEAALFGRVASGEIAKNLIHVFQLKERAKKTTLDGWFPRITDPALPVPIRTIGIVGSGVMGSGIAHWCAAHGYGVILCDVRREAIERGVAVIRELFADGVRRGKVTPEDAHRMTGGIGITTSLEDFEYCDCVIEAIAEDTAAKQKVFAELSSRTKADCLLATNSSVTSLEELASVVAHPERVIGIHFFNLVSRMPGIELVLGVQTNRETAERALALAKGLGKTAVISRSSPGSYVTRTLFFYLNEACRLWEQGLSTTAIDSAMREWGWPMGPMRLIDEIGLDVADDIFHGLEKKFPDRFTASKLCRALQAEGWLGRKNGVSSGFYEYAPGAETLSPAAAKFASADQPLQWQNQAIQDHLNGVLMREANRALAEGVVKTRDDADLALLMGAGFPAFRGGLSRCSGAGGSATS